MTTRASLKITYGETVIYFYRRCDGFPNVAGRELCETLEYAGNLTNFVTLIIENGDYTMTPVAMICDYSYHVRFTDGEYWPWLDGCKVEIGMVEGELYATEVPKYASVQEFLAWLNEGIED
jgi:hypothetical protein